MCPSLSYKHSVVQFKRYVVYIDPAKQSTIIQSHTHKSVKNKQLPYACDSVPDHTHIGSAHMKIILEQK